MAQDYGPAQPIADWVDKYVYTPAKKVMGTVDKIPSKQSDSSTNAGKLPDAWEEANKRSQQTKLADRKPLGTGKATTKKATKKPLARKR